MPTQTKTKLANFDPAKYHGLDRDALIRVYRTMFLSRRLDDREIQLKRQNQDLLPDQRRGPRSGARGRRSGLEASLRLVLPVLSRSRACAHARRHSLRNAAARQWARRTIPHPAAARCRRTGAIGTEYRHALLTHRHAMPARVGAAEAPRISRNFPRPSSRRARRRWAPPSPITATRSPTSPPATAPRARANFSKR